MPFFAETTEDSSAERFERDVRPVLVEHCFACHGPDKQKSGLRLDSAVAMRAGGSRGPTVEPGNAASLLLDVIRYTGDVQMPPKERLPQEAVDSITAWVMEGAVWPEYSETPLPAAPNLAEVKARHWAYQPLATVLAPVVEDAAWPKSDIDRFILHQIEAQGMRPAAPADKRTLIRRVTIDLIGLPPSPEDVKAFVEDTSPDAYARVIDRLLASPQYGERWARHWLDVVRYTDSFDSRATAQTDPVEIWRYRDWVVNAFNDDMPYDQFLRNQIAGDLLPGPDGGFNRDGLIATGMLAIGNWPQGDADKQKMVTDIVDDQIDVVTRTMLGMTMACARCHDHKFDPYTTEDYYGLAGIFFSSSILPGPGAKTEGSPILHLPLASKEELAARTAREERINVLRAERDTLLVKERAALALEESAKTAQYILAAHQGASVEAEGLHPDVLRQWSRLLNGDSPPALLTVEENFQSIPGLHSRHDAESTPSSVANTTDNELKYSTITQPPHSLVIHPSPTDGVGLGWRAPVDAAVAISGRIADADGNCGNGVRWTVAHWGRGFDRVVADGQIPNGGDGVIAIDAPMDVKQGEQILLTVLPDGDYSCDTTVVDLQLSGAGETWSTASDILPHFTVGNPWPDAAGRPDVWRLFAGSAAPLLDPILFAPWWTALEEVEAGRRGPEAIEEAAKIVEAGVLADFGPGVAALLSDQGPFWLTSPPPAANSRRVEVEAELRELESQTPAPLDYAVGIQEGGVPGTEHEGIHDVHVHRRGSYTTLGDLVPRRMPAVLAQSSPRPVSEGSGRRDLANWVTNDCAALTARVMVNRIWQHHFGEGLVRTPGDFGAQGQAPTHPALLDYLARRFIESGWSVKALHREILNSATYRQSSLAPDESVTQDPDNLYLARMNRRRLDAETLRDSILFVTSQLDLTAGGPAYVEMATPRRTLYLRTVRSNLSTYTMLFDGADPTAVTPERNQSIVVPQALFTLNNEFTLDQAQALAESIQFTIEGAVVAELYLRLFARAPTDEEFAVGESALTGLGFPSKDAIAAYAHVLLSTNEFYFVD
jgi:hypothetical protein